MFRTQIFRRLVLFGDECIRNSLRRSCLSSRQQFVSINGESSNKLPVTCGVPQGSILGPLLFLIYINDIASSSKSLQFILFADDTNLFMSSNNLKDLQQKLMSAFGGLSCWFKANKSTLNLDKTLYILFSSRWNTVILTILS